jgi:putative transposase
MRWHAHYHTVGTGHLYQGRFKTFPIEEEEYLLAVLRYALRASLCERAESWKYGSLWRATEVDSEESRELLTPWPIGRPRTWKAMVHRAQNQ